MGYFSYMEHARRHVHLLLLGIFCISASYSFWVYSNAPQYPLLIPICATILPCLLAYLCWNLFIKNTQNKSKAIGLVVGFACGWSILCFGFVGWLLDAVITGRTGQLNFGDFSSIAQLIFFFGPTYLLLLKGWIPLLLCTLLVFFLAGNISNKQR